VRHDEPQRRRQRRATPQSRHHSGRKRIRVRCSSRPGHIVGTRVNNRRNRSHHHRNVSASSDACPPPVRQKSKRRLAVLAAGPRRAPGAKGMPAFFLHVEPWGMDDTGIDSFFNPTADAAGCREEVTSGPLRCQVPEDRNYPVLHNPGDPCTAFPRVPCGPRDTRIQRAMRQPERLVVPVGHHLGYDAGRCGGHPGRRRLTPAPRERRPPVGNRHRTVREILVSIWTRILFLFSGFFVAFMRFMVETWFRCRHSVATLRVAGPSRVLRIST
jgi:hypothetical protein